MSAAAELKRLQAKAKREALENKFLFIWKAINGPPLEREFRFDSARKWRIDFADPVVKLGIEAEGGSWVAGAHTRGAHFESDCIKYMEAILKGWSIIRLTGDMLTRANLQRIADYIVNARKAWDERVGT